MLERRGIAWRGWNWRTPESSARAECLAELERGRHDFLFLYSAVLDAHLHREGSRGASVRASLAEWSAWLDAAATAAARGGREAWLYLCSDHGMVDVHAAVDVMGRLRGLPWRRQPPPPWEPPATAIEDTRIRIAPTAFLMSHPSSARAQRAEGTYSCRLLYSINARPEG